METSQLHYCCREPISIDLVRVSKHQQNTEFGKIWCLANVLMRVKECCTLLSVFNVLDFTEWRNYPDVKEWLTNDIAVPCCEDEPVLNSQWCEKLSFIPLTWIEDNLGEYLFNVTKEWQTERRQLLSFIVFTTVTRCLFVVFNYRHLM
ncbi:hypothetical protein FOCC_FOCC015269 [Frankliniella occidentalis]|nr:hypothetical protein FOCC_FOCC015269 [Frankliniella occidentalis]